MKSGDKFSAIVTISNLDILVTGKVQIENDIVYLCQNLKNGSSCRDKLGYDFCWCVGNKIYLSIDNLMRIEGFKNFKIIPDRNTEYKLS